MRVVILMSTFEGERFVADQLRSILDQLPADGRVLVRDDGSRDRTVETVKALADGRIEVATGTNIGFARSFLALMDSAPTDADVYMLADQDDIWLPGKIERAAAHLRRVSPAVPALYCSRLHLVDIDLKSMGVSPSGPESSSFQQALTENIVVGCTAAFNRAALELARQAGDRSLIHFHDWWLYLVVAAFGVVHFDPEPTVDYRQHGSNVLGMGAGIRRYTTIARFLARVNFVHVMFNQIENFRRVYGAHMSTEQRALLARYFDQRSLRSVARLILSPTRHKRRRVDDILLRGMLVFAIISGRGLVPRQSR